MAEYYGTVRYPYSSLNTARERIDLSFFYKEVSITVSCQILEAGFTDRQEAMRFKHPDPPFSRFFIFTEGGASVTIPSGKLELKPGKIYHLPPKQPFDIRYEISKLIYFHIHVTDTTGQALLRAIKGIPEIDNSNLFARYLEGFQDNDKMQTLSAITDTLRILLRPQMDDIATQAKQAKSFSLLFDYLQNTPIAEITITELAELYEKTPDALSKQFRKTMGISLKDFLAGRQLVQAQELLLHSEKTVSQIAEELGHSNSQYFHRFFKKHCLCTPREYRINAALNIAEITH